MFETMLVLWAACWLMKTLAVDAKYAAKGVPTPRQQIRIAQLKSSGSTETASSPRYGSREYFADLKSDLLKAKTEKRRERYAKKRKDLETVTTDPITAAAPVEIISPEKVSARIVKCDKCGKMFTMHKDETQEGSPAFCPPCTAEARCRIKESHKEVKPTTAPASAPVATIEKKEDPMSEVTGLASAIAYADQVAAAHAAHSMAGGESYLTSLQSYQVTGQTISLVASAQEASSMAADAWAAASQALSKQNMVKEAYDNNPDAGNQQFVQGE